MRWWRSRKRRSPPGARVALKAEARAHPRIAEIGRDAWDACAGASGYAHNPFVSYDFLHALEESGCVGGRTGWSPAHVSVEHADGKVAGVMPLYLKTHSQGEYVFDHSWANAYMRAGGDYYPKLQCAAPFSPVTGPRLIAADGPDRDDAIDSLLAAAIGLTEQTGASSLHVTFPLEAEWRRLWAARGRPRLRSPESAFVAFARVRAARG